MLPCHARCALSCLRCNGHSLLLSSYLSMIGRIENPSCRTCGHPSQDTSHLILHCPATDSLRHSLFGNSPSLYDLWSRPWDAARFLGLHGLLPCSIPWKGLVNNNNNNNDMTQTQSSSSLVQKGNRHQICTVINDHTVSCDC